MNSSIKKIIHIDMDCFYAAIEMRDNPSLRNKPIAVGGHSERRGVLCTCNYKAREYGVHSAMPTAHALRLCPDLICLPVNMIKYREVSNGIQKIFHEYSDCVEPLSLDEAFIDVSECTHHQGSATWIAQAIRESIWQQFELTASAGVAPNKFLAKIASDWKKPNGLFVITPEQVDAFIKQLLVKKIFGVGKVTAQKLAHLGIENCEQLQQHSLIELTQHFGTFGARLYDLSRGIDKREVTPHRVRKSLSVEETFSEDLPNVETCLHYLPELYQQLIQRLQRHSDKKIKKQFVKIKFFDFKQTTVEQCSEQLNLDKFVQLCQQGYEREQKPVRLLGLGVRFAEDSEKTAQLSFDV